jgi:hypothetical protein
LLQVPILMVGLGEILCLMLLGKCVINLPLSFMLATLHMYFLVKMKKWDIVEFYRITYTPL